MTFDAERAADAFKVVASDGERRFALSTAIASACQLAVQQGYPTFQPLPFHSGRIPRQRARHAFRDSGAFRVELSEIVTRSLWRPPAAPRTRRATAASRSATSGSWPSFRRACWTNRRGSRRPASKRATTLVEVGVYAFVATRL